MTAETRRQLFLGYLDCARWGIDQAAGLAAESPRLEWPTRLLAAQQLAKAAEDLRRAQTYLPEEQPKI